MPSTPSQPDPTKNLNEFNKFLQNNTDFLKQKYSQHYSQPFPFPQLQTKPRIQQSIKFIYDVFSFQKYEKDEKMNLTLRKSLRDNILGFLRGEQDKEGKKFMADDGIRLLKYCIENNQMFAVHYDKKDKQVEVGEGKKEDIGKVEQQQEVNNNEESGLKPQKHGDQESQDQQQPQNDQSTNKVQANHSHISKKTKHSTQQKTQPHIPPPTNQFTPFNKTEQEKKHNQILKKQAKIVFDFYCKQQLNTGGPNATFDKILHEANTMTLGKFMAFANSTRILYTAKIQALKPKDYKVLDKKTINDFFRRISKAQKEIDFDQFFDLIKTLNDIDSTVYDKLNMDKSETHNKILRKLKYLTTPFSMKGHLEEESQFIIDQKPYIPINTAHSGRFQSSLKEDLEQRKQKLRLLPHQPYPNPNPLRPHDTFLAESQFRQGVLDQDMFQSKIKGPNGFLLHRKGQSKTTTDNNKPNQETSKIRLENSRVSFENGHKLSEQINLLQGLIMPDDDNDDIFLKDYKIPKLASNAGLKKKSIHNMSIPSHKNSEQGRQSARKFSGMKTQRKNVVDELKQRILQVEKTQRKQLFTGIDSNRRKAVSNYNNKY